MSLLAQSVPTEDPGTFSRFRTQSGRYPAIAEQSRLM